MSEYEDRGEIEIACADDANVPVGIRLRLVTTDEIDEGDLSTGDAPVLEGYWILEADCYQPRRDEIRRDHFEAVSADRDALARVVREVWLPLYRHAVRQLEALSDPMNDDEDSLGYWSAV